MVPSFASAFSFLNQGILPVRCSAHRGNADSTGSPPRSAENLQRLKNTTGLNQPAPWQSCIPTSSSKQSSSLLPPRPRFLCTAAVETLLGSPWHLVQHPHTLYSPFCAPGVRGAQHTSGTTNAPALKAPGVGPWHCRPALGNTTTEPAQGGWQNRMSQGRPPSPLAREQGAEGSGTRSNPSARGEAATLAATPAGAMPVLCRALCRCFCSCNKDTEQRGLQPVTAVEGRMCPAPETM